MSPGHFYAAMAAWYATHARDLPWRHTRDPYAVWLSEVILQQTRISQGMAYWQRFMRAWPTVESLARASEDEVLKMWQGLGYYSRARNLHSAARQVAEAGAFPHTLEGIRALKGVGDYTAAAIASLAFGLPVAAVDGNAYRVLARMYGIATPIDTTEGKKTFARLADSLASQAPLQTLSPWGESCGGAALLNQAIMDFGATLCTPKAPQCQQCPLAEECEARCQGSAERLPVKLRKQQMQTRRLTYIYIRCREFTALHRRGAGDIWQGLWEPPLFENQPLPQWPGRLILKASGVRHVLTHRILVTDFFVLDTGIRPVLPPDYRWISECDLKDYAVPRLVEKLLQMV